MEEAVRYCSGCGTEAPGWLAPDTRPRPESDKKDAPNPPIPSVDSEKHKEPIPHPIEERLKALEHLIGTWINKNRRLSLLLTFLSLVIGIGGLWFLPDFFKRRTNPPPDAVFIEVEKNATEVEAGGQLKLIARTSPVENLPGDFKWEPAEMIEGNGQRSVLFKPPKDGRHAAYSATVSLKTFDRSNNPGPSAEPKSITVLPEGQTNHKPEFNAGGEGIHIEGRTEVQSGASVNLDALAIDKDGDPLKYDWSVESRLVQIEKNGDRRVTLKLPKDFARRGNVYLTVKLIVSDGKGGFSDPERATLTVTPQGHVRISRRKRIGDQIAAPSQAKPSEPAKPNPSPALAVPQATREGEKQTRSLGPNGRVKIARRYL